jgi:ATP-dependent Lhr-like helicase
LRDLGDLDAGEVAQRCRDAAARRRLAALEQERRAKVRVAGVERWIAAEDAARYRDALGWRCRSGCRARC